MRIAIIVSTRNRARLLQSFLQSVGKLQLGGLELETHIVDNGSRDATPDLLASLPAQAANGVDCFFHCVERPGKSRALNYALDQIRGEVVAFLDDDVQLQPDWAIELARGFEFTGADALQGGVELKLPRKPAWWVTPRVQAICAATTLWTSLTPVVSLNGSNMAARVRQDMPRFCEEIGPGSPPFTMGEDSEWSGRLLRSGWKGAFWPAARVIHDFDQRLTLAEVLFRQRHSGWNQLVFCDPGGRAALRRQALLGLPYSLAKAVLRLVVGKRLVALDNLLDGARYYGVLEAQWRGISAHPCWSHRKS